MIIRRRSGSSAHQGMLVIALMYGWSGLSMLVQPGRWSDTAAYTGIFAVLPAHTWSVLFLIAGALLAIAAATCPRWGAMRFIAFGLTMTLTTSWLAAFFLRWLTSDAPPATAGSFVVYLWVLLSAARLHDEHGGAAP